MFRIRNLVALLMIPLVLSYGVSALGSILRVVSSPRPLLWFGLGMALSFVVLWVLSRRGGSGLGRNFHHELAHLIFCYLLFVKVERFTAGSRAGPDGRVGAVEHRAVDPVRSTLIALAPYFFPVFSVGLLVVRVVVTKRIVPAVDFLVGASMAYFLVINWKQLGFHQTDLQRSGRFFSVVFLVLTNIVMLTGVLVIIHRGYLSGWRFLKSGIQPFVDWHHLSHHLAQLKRAFLGLVVKLKGLM